MAAFAERQRNNIRMGIFVSISLLLGLGIVVALTGALDSLRGRSTVHTVRFTVQSGVSNLKTGSEVRVGGMRLGEVVRLLPQIKPGEPFQYIDVEFALDQSVQLYENARIMVSSPLIGAEAWLDITSVGEGPIATGVLVGSERVGMLTALLGDDGANNTQRMLQDTQQFTAFLASINDEYERNVLPILEDFQSASGGTREFVASFRQDDWPRWVASVDSLMNRANQSISAFDAMLSEGHGLLSDGRDVLAENRDDLRTSVAQFRIASENWQRATQRISDETVDRIHALLDTGQDGLREMREAAVMLRQDYDGWATNISEALGRANIASQQLSLTMTEVRRSPWKVLYRPSEKELEHELLYEAARSFAVAAADLKAASTSMQRIMENHSERLSDDAELLDRVRMNLLAPLDRYEIAQQRLLDVLFADR